MKENNKIIAEFLGWNKKINKDGEETSFYNLPIKFNNPQGIKQYIPLEGFIFDSDWNWLMEVVERIESIKDPYHGRFGVYIGSNSCTIQSTNFRPDKPIQNPPHYYSNSTLDTKIESTYNEVFKFINFYNIQELK